MISSTCLRQRGRPSTSSAASQRTPSLGWHQPEATAQNRVIRTPGTRSPLLGYDVADYDLLGGLTNCGYTPDEAPSLAPAWAPLLNEWHQFANPEDAMAYAAVTAQRVPEHAPFFGYGIYQLG
jgi:hypothetical protein